VKDFLKTLKLNEDTLSNVLTVLVFILVGVLIFNYFKSVNKTTREQTSSATTESLTPEQQANQTVTQAVGQGLPAVYTIKTGDSLWKISQQAYGSGYQWPQIYAANKAVIKNPGILYAGTQITLPKLNTQLTTYTVVSGDNLWNISLKYCGSGFTWTKIATDNTLPNPRLIQPGLKLNIICK
jgi:nucleoid-associated protein YgaU